MCRSDCSKVTDDEEDDDIVAILKFILIIDKNKLIIAFFYGTGYTHIVRVYIHMNVYYMYM
jgi:hypothetical protein